MTDAERASIKSAAEYGGKYFREEHGKAEFGERERVLLRFLEDVTSGPTVADGLWEEMRRLFCEREIVEILSLQVWLFRGEQKV